MRTPHNEQLVPWKFDGSHEILKGRTGVDRRLQVTILQPEKFTPRHHPWVGKVSVKVLLMFTLSRLRNDTKE